MPKKALTTASPSPAAQVKKHVAAIHTSGELTLLERKMSNVLLLNAYDALLTRRTHRIPIKHMCAMLGWDESNNTERLQEALTKLASTAVRFNMMEDGKEVWRVMSMISYGEIKDGICTYRYDEYLAERLYDPEVYATINIGVQRRFDGGYALTLYENCVRYRTVGSTGWWEIERYRSLLGATASMYNEFKYLKRDVITKPLTEVNKVSDIQLEAEFKKNGRNVVAVRFIITENPQQMLLKPEVDAEHAALRETETFKRLREHGIGERLALAWILQDEVRARAVVDYVENKDRQRKVKSTSGLIRTLIESGAEVGPTVYEKKKQETAVTQKEALDRTIEQDRIETQAIKAASEACWAEFLAWPEEKRNLYIDQYIKPNAPVYKAYQQNGLSSAFVRNIITGQMRSEKAAAQAGEGG